MNLSTLALAKDLEAAGFTRAQAESVAEKFAAISEQHRDELVTKDYLKAQLAEFSDQLRNELVTKDQLNAQLAELSVQIRDSHINTIKWLVGLLAGFLALVVTFIYFLVK